MFDINEFLDSLIRFKNKKGEFKIELKKINNIYLDFDDIIPFFLFFNKKDEIKEQINLSKKYLVNGFIPLRNHLYSWRMDEYLGGIINYYESTKDNDIKNLIIKQESFLNAIFKLNYIPGYINLKNKSISKLSFSRGYGIIEVCLENNIFSKRTKFNALKVLDNFIFNNLYFKRNSLFLNKNLYFMNKFIGKSFRFPSRFKFIGLSSLYFSKSRFRNFYTKILQMIPLSSIQLMKDNSNLIFSIIEAYKYTKNNKYKQILKKWIYNGVLKKIYDNKGYIYTSYNNKSLNNVLLSQNFTILDIFNDYYYFVEKDEYLLNISKNIADFWISKKMKNGLIPENLIQNISFLDCQTDFSISLKKLFHLTKEEKYNNAGKSLYESIIKNFQRKNYFVLRIDENSKIYDNNINFKYNALFLKAYISYNYDLNIFNSIFKDR